MRVVRRAVKASCRFVIHEIDQGEPRSDLCASHAIEPFGDLIVEERGSGIQQVHRQKSVGHAPDHFIAVRTDWRQIDEIIEQRQRLNRRHFVGTAFQEKLFESGAHIVLRLPESSSSAKFWLATRKVCRPSRQRPPAK